MRENRSTSSGSMVSGLCCWLLMGSFGICSAFNVKTCFGTIASRCPGIGPFRAVILAAGCQCG
jgi:hypothetical protein